VHKLGPPGRICQLAGRIEFSHRIVAETLIHPIGFVNSVGQICREIRAAGRQVNDRAQAVVGADLLQMRTSSEV
jgi:hypothetical protein